MENKNPGIKIQANLYFTSQLDYFENKIKHVWGINLDRANESQWFYQYSVGAPCRFYTQKEQMVERRLYAKGLQSMKKFKEKR